MDYNDDKFDHAGGHWHTGKKNQKDCGMTPLNGGEPDPGHCGTNEKIKNDPEFNHIAINQCGKHINYHEFVGRCANECLIEKHEQFIQEQCS